MSCTFQVDPTIFSHLGKSLYCCNYLKIYYFFIKIVPIFYNLFYSVTYFLHCSSEFQSFGSEPSSLNSEHTDKKEAPRVNQPSIRLFDILRGPLQHHEKFDFEFDDTNEISNPFLIRVPQSKSLFVMIFYVLLNKSKYNINDTQKRQYFCIIKRFTGRSKALNSIIIF